MMYASRPDALSEHAADPYFVDAARPHALPVEEAEALLASLPGVISARIVGGPNGIGDVHVLTGADVAPKQTVRNVESALFARYGVRVDHRKVSVATTTGAAHARAATAPRPEASGATAGVRTVAQSAMAPAGAGESSVRRFYFEDVEARRSSRGTACRVVLRRGEQLVEGEAESPASGRGRVDEVAARATVAALGSADASASALALEGSERLSMFGREFVFVAVAARQGRGATLLTGSAEVRDGGAEAAAVLAVLDATNRWTSRMR